MTTRLAFLSDAELARVRADIAGRLLAVLIAGDFEPDYAVQRAVDLADKLMIRLYKRLDE